MAQMAAKETPTWLIAARAADAKKAIDLRVLDLREITAFTDHFIICSISSSRQGQAIADEIGTRLKDAGRRPASVEGYERGEWILIDYGEFIVHIFSEPARKYYDLERLWRHAVLVDLNAPAMTDSRY